MVDEDRPGDEPENEVYEDEGPRSIFSAIWFRVIVVVVVLGVVAAVAVPYVLDWVSPTPESVPAGKVVAPAPTTPPAPPVAAAPPAAPTAAVVPPPAASAKGAPAKPAPAPLERAVPAPAAPAEPVEKATSKKPASIRPTSKATKGATTKVPAGSGTYWLQVGAFRDAATAERLAERLRAQKYPVEQSMSGEPRTAAAASAKPSTAPRSPGSDLYDVFVSGGSPATLSAKLGAKGLAAEPQGDGVVVKPSLPLRDAVALSRDLATEGLKVQVKRAGGAAPAASAPPAPASSAERLHRVRVGPYADRTAATAARRELEAAGFKPYIAREGQ